MYWIISKFEGKFRKCGKIEIKPLSKTEFLSADFHKILLSFTQIVNNMKSDG
jgi:hypothetical protein